MVTGAINICSLFSTQYRVFSFRCSAPVERTGDDRKQEKHQENIKENLGDAGCAGRDAGEAKQRRNKRDHEENDCPA